MISPHNNGKGLLEVGALVASLPASETASGVDVSGVCSLQSPAQGCAMEGVDSRSRPVEAVDSRPAL
eukprot:3844142-Prorocentrum_lima.AAC.1